MELFKHNASENILPQDGGLFYYGKIFSSAQANNYLQYLLEEIPWQHDEAFVFGNKILTKRKVAWYGDEGFRYTYSGATKHAIPWSKTLLGLKNIIEEKSGAIYNSCLMNLYHNGEEGVGWHSDDEKSLTENAAIASLSFGAERKFSFRHKSLDKKLSVLLEHGSLLIMQDEIQKFWKHAILKSTKIKEPRVSLTFRKMKIETGSDLVD